MRLVFDIQSLQSASRLRGIGRYTRSLLSALQQERDEHEMVLLLNGAFSGKRDLIAELKLEIPFAECVICNLPGPTAAHDVSNEVRASLAEIIREAFIAELKPDLVHVFSALEGFEDNVVTSIGRWDAGYPVTATFYDLIPLLNPEEYLKTNKAFSRHYTNRLGDLARADGLLAISHFSASEAIEHLPYPEDKVGVASLGPLTPTQAHDVANSDTDDPLLALGLPYGFLLYVGGSDPRKNLPRLVEAWCALPESLQHDHPLVIAGSMPRQDVATLRGIAKNKSVAPSQLRFLGQISDEVLEHLYSSCSAFVFPSWHEGFGLPALEAMASGAAVIAANASSLPEVVGLDEALFDPFNISEIRGHLERVLTDAEYLARLRTHAPQQAAKFSWQNTARDAVTFFERVRANTQPLANEVSPQEWQAQYPQRLQHLIARLVEEIRREPKAKTRRELASQVAAAIEQNEKQLLQIRLRSEGAVTPWLIEGPFDSSYSLALLNRELARGLSRRGVEVRLHSSEGPGDFDPDPEFLARTPDLAAMVVSPEESRQPTAIGSRLMYPPRVNDMPSDFAMLHLYGWEEGELPREWIEEFNLYLNGVTTMSRYVSKVLIDNGATVPLAVAGVGVDHWERVEPDPQFTLPDEASGFIFLHVSSCFPRKGVDALLSAWGRAFTSADDVTLVIKTFANPHNTVHQLLEAAQRDHVDYPRVLVIEKDLTDSELKKLMMESHALVAPSRGEGFGLPVAEAMLSGLPVIATAHGGHMDFCTDENSWLVDYDFARARTHFGLSDSVWAEPCEQDLVNKLRAVWELAPEERSKRAGVGRERLLQEYTWEKVAARVMRAAERWKLRQREPRPVSRIGWVSSWNTRCGIAGYSAYLLQHFESEVRVYASHRTPEEELDKWLLPADGPEVTRCWQSGFGDQLDVLIETMLDDLPEAVVIQFNYGFFEFAALAELIKMLKRHQVTVVVMFHSTFDPPELPERRLDLLRDALLQCDRLLVHSPQDLNRLKAIGLVENTALIPHGVITREQPATPRPAGAVARPANVPLRIASFGFLLPHKGLEQLLDAMALLREQGIKVVLHMLNAEYPAAVSREAIADISARIQALGLGEAVSLDTTYYTDEECLERLARSDLVVFPYQATHESSSAAVRHAIASGVPVAVTPLDIFDDVAPAVIALPGSSPSAISAGIATISSWQVHDWQDYTDRAAAWRHQHSHYAIAQRLEGMIRGLVGGCADLNTGGPKC